MYIERESYVQEYRRQEKLAGIENRWQIEELMRARQGPSLWRRIKLWWQGVGRPKAKAQPALNSNCVDCAVS